MSNGGSKYRYVICECGLSHLPAQRQARLRRMLPEAPSIIAKHFPCIYPTQADGKSINPTLYRDLRAIGAVKLQGQSDWDVKPQLDGSSRTVV